MESREIFAIALLIGLIFFIWFSRKVDGPLNAETGLAKPVSVSGLDTRLKLVKYGTLSRSQAEAKMQECLRFADQYFEYGEEAMSKTHIGFARSADHWLKVDFHLNNEFHVFVGRAITSKRHENPAILDSYDALSALIDQYYRHTTDFPVVWNSAYNRESEV
jgi:hypothetical protein